MSLAYSLSDELGVAACVVDGCEKQRKPGRQWCSMHSERVRLEGEPGEAAPRSRARKPIDPAVRFFAKVNLDGPGGCWLWTGTITGRSGYGGFSIGSKAAGTARMIGAHRWAYEHLVGPVPDGLDLDHLCRVRSCVNPDHLEPVTPRENAIRGIGPTAVNAAKMECVNGHPFDEVNTYYHPNGHRACRACRRAIQARYRESKRSA